jgi:hypothetical protein
MYERAASRRCFGVLLQGGGLFQSTDDAMRSSSGVSCIARVTSAPELKGPEGVAHLAWL